MYIIPVYTKRFTQDSKWNVHETAVITCDISIVLQQWSSARLAYCLHQILPQDRTLDQRSIRRLLHDYYYYYYYYYLSATFFFSLWSNLWSTLVCCVFVPRKPSETNEIRFELLSFRIIFRRKSMEISFLFFFLFKNYFLLFFNSIFVSGGDVTNHVTFRFTEKSRKNSQEGELKKVQKDSRKKKRKNTQ